MSDVNYLIGQRVIIYNRVIGHVVPPESPTTFINGIWVFNPENDYSSCYDKCNIKPLPNGQL